MWSNQPEIILQEAQMDCGPACLLSIVRYYGGQADLATLRLKCGVNSKGATFLGLRAAALSCGFDAEGMEGDLPALLQMEGPCILHLSSVGAIGHYVVFFGAQRELSGMMYQIGDPGAGMQQYTARRLETLWSSRAVLVLKPNDQFNRPGYK